MRSQNLVGRLIPDLLASPLRVCWDGPLILIRDRYAASGRLLFFVSIPMGVYRARCVPGRGKNLRSESELQAGGTGRSVFGNRRSATDEASPGPAAVPDGRVAALARQAWLEIPSPAGGLAFQREAGRRGGDRGDRGRS